MSKKLEFTVSSSSSSELYYVHLHRYENKLICTCTCPAGQKQQACKHRLSILDGDMTNVQGGDTDRASEIKDFLVGSDVETALEKLRDLNSQKDALDKQIKAQKKLLSRTLQD